MTGNTAIKKIKTANGLSFGSGSPRKASTKQIATAIIVNSISESPIDRTSVFFFI
jgi:hypothetical protein